MQRDTLGIWIKRWSEARNHIQTDQRLLLVREWLNGDRIVGETDLSETDRISDRRNSSRLRRRRARLLEACEAAWPRLTCRR